MVPCVLLKHEEGRLVGWIILQVDDSFGLYTADFTREEEEAAKRLKLKTRLLIGERYNEWGMTKDERWWEPR